MSTDNIEVLSHAFDINIIENFQDRDYSEIHMWSKTPDGSTVLIRLKDVPFTCYLELPRVIEDEAIEWSENCDEIRHLIRHLERSLADHKFINWEFEYKYKLHYYGNLFPMIKLYFKTGEHLRHCKNLVKKTPWRFSDSSIKLDIWEADIDIFRKLMTERRAQYSQWCSIMCKEIPYEHTDRISVIGRGNKEYFGDPNSLRTLSSEESKHLVSYPSFLSIDIETYSPNHRSMPKSLKHDCPCYMISCVYQVLGKPEEREDYVIVMGDFCPLPGKKIIRVNNEVEEMNALADLINKLDPDVLSGYNIVTYDFPYMNDRLMYMMREWKPCGRIEGEKTYVHTTELRSAAYGINKICTLKARGRITLDALQIIKRDYKLDNFKLETVSQFFLKKGKHDISAQDMFRIYKELKTSEDKYKAEIIRLDSSSEKSAEEKDIESKLKEHRKILSEYVNEEIENEENCLTRKLEEIKSKRLDSFVNPKVLKRFQEAKTKFTSVISYCIQDSVLVLELFEKLNMWISLMTFSSVVGVTMSDIFSRGQQIRCQSQIYDECAIRNIVIDSRPKKLMHYSGAFVAKPLVGRHDNIIGLDFNSLYPNIIIAFNICYTTFIKSSDWKKFKEEDVEIIKFSQVEPISPPEGVDMIKDTDEEDDDDDDDEKNEKKTHTVEYEYRFVKAHVKKGILPILLERLISERKSTRAYLKTVSNDLDTIKTLSGIISCIEENITSLDEFKENNKIEINKIDEKIKKESNKKVKVELEKRKKNLTTTNDFIYITNLEESSFKGILNAINKESIINSLKEEIKTKDQEINNLKELIKNKTEENLKSKIKKISKEKDKISNDLKKLIKWKEFLNMNSYTEFMSKYEEYVQSKDIELICLDKKQLAIKVSANSVYGFLGAQKTGLIPFIEAALCVTAKGRILINAVNDYVIKKYNAKVVYGDTDSSMIDFGITDPKLCHYWGHKMEDEINGVPEREIDGIIYPEVPGLFPKPLRIEFEKGMRIFCICPKKYAYFQIEEDGEFEKDDDGEIILHKKGILLARRDNTPKIREIYKKLLMMVMFDKSIDEAFEYLISEIINLITGKVEVEDLAITRGIGANYKQDGYFLKVFSQELSRMGNPVESGDRVSSIVVKTIAEIRGEKVPLGLKMRLPEMYYQARIEASKPPGETSEEEKKYIYPVEEIDSIYYLEHAFMNPLDQLFQVGFKELENYTCIGYNPQYSNSHYKSIVNPVKMISYFIKDFFKFYKKNGVDCTDAEKFQDVKEVLEGLPNWFRDTRKRVLSRKQRKKEIMS